MSEFEAAMAISRLLPREARWAYWQQNGGPMFVYNTERVKTQYGSPVDGQFESCVFVPYGPGSKSGKAMNWKELEGSRSAHVLRRDAKARAWRLYQGWLATGKVEV